MSKLKIMIVFGTRPEAIKMAPLVKKLKERPNDFDVLVCVTAQHREMLDQALGLFEIRPDIDLNLMRSGQDLSDITATILIEMRDIFSKHEPDLILVHGDTTTALAVSMAGFYNGIAIGHVEAGLRTYNLSAPFPEEFNRQVISKLAKWHFAPTHVAYSNLVAEGCISDDIEITGNTVIDSLYWILQRIENDRRRREVVEKSLDSKLPFCWASERFVLVTGHRRENFGHGFSQICSALRALALNHPSVRFVYPLHLNPNVRMPVTELLSGLPNVHLVEPMEYEEFVCLLSHANMVLTDSGGIQEEAPSLGKPVLVMRDVTERPEAVRAGTVELVGADRDRIVNAVTRLLTDYDHYSRMSTAHNPYGDGEASDRIVAFLQSKKGSVVE